jgi:PIN domain nuclease of toxin-antitoxin system
MEADLLVLDTHVWIWLMEGLEKELSSDAVREIVGASQDGLVCVSAISVWEVAMLEARGRIRLSRSVDEWVRSALRAPGTRLLDLTPDIAIESTRLPAPAPGEPADRILMASARVEGGRLATRDRAILEYATAGHLRVVDATP